MSLVLRDYQKEAAQSIIQLAREAVETKKRQKALIVQPTGAGKTVMMLVACRFLFKAFGWKTLIIVPSVKLVEQTIKSAKKFYPEWETGKIGDSEFTVSDTTELDVATAAGCHPERLKNEGVKTDKYQIIIVDECHHAAAESFQAILTYFAPAILRIGFTATIKRGDGVSVAAPQFFSRIVAFNTLGRLTDQGYLVPAKGFLVKTGLTLSNDEDDFENEGLSNSQKRNKADTPERNGIAVDAWFEYAKMGSDFRKTIAFCVSIQHAENLAEMFRERGISAEAISGSMSPRESNRILDDFRSNKIKILCNCNLLIEGFDEPEVSCVLITRPATAASMCVLGPQMIGRALRLHPESGKSDAIVIELRDNKKKKKEAVGGSEGDDLSSIENAFDLELELNVEAHLGGIFLHDLAKMRQKLSVAEERKKMIRYLTTSRDQLGEIITEMFDVIETISKSTILSWIPLGNTYYLDLGEGNFGEIVNEDGAWTIRIIFEDSAFPIGITPHLLEAFNIADSWVSANCRSLKLLSRKEPWRNGQPTEQQLKRIMSLTGLTKEFYAEMNRGQVSDLIGYYMAMKRLREKC